MSPTGKISRRSTVAGALSCTLLAAAAALSACGGSTAADGGGASSGATITLGEVFPLSGPAASSSQEMRNGVTLALDEINSKGGVDGHKLKVVAYDDKLDPSTTVTVFSQAVTQGKVAAVIGPYSSSEVAPIKSASHRLKTVDITPTAETGSLTQGPEAAYLFRTSPVTAEDTAEAVRIAKNVGCKAPGLLHDSGDYGTDYSNGILAAISPLHLAANVTYASTATDVTAQVQSLKAAGADCVFDAASAGATAGLIIKTMASLGYDVPVIGPDSLTTADMQHVAGSAIGQLKGVYADQALDTTKPAYTALLKRYETQFSATPVSPFWVSAYDATNILAKGLAKSGGKGGAALDAALQQLTSADYQQVYGAAGASGEFSATKHDWLSGAYMKAFKVTQTTVSPATDVQ